MLPRADGGGKLRSRQRGASSCRAPPSGTMPYVSGVSHSGGTMTAVAYKGFAITPRTFQIHGSGRWTLDLLIGRNRRLRAFSGGETYSTEKAAINGCCEFGRRIIDGLVQQYPREDLP